MEMITKKVLLGILVTGVIGLAAALSPRIASTVHALPPAQGPDRPGLTVPDSGPPPHDAGAAADSDQPAYTVQSVTASSHLGSEIVISALANKQHLPAVAYNWKHHEYLVVWHNEWSGGRTDIYAQRVTEAGEVKSWFAVTADPQKDRAQPAVAYDPVNDRYLVVWTYDYWGHGSDWDIRGRFIPWDGPDASLSEFDICKWNTKQWNPKVAYARAQEEFLVVWWTEIPFVPDYVSGKRVPADGSPIINPESADVTINHGTDLRVNPDVAYNLARNEYLVTYYDNHGNIYGTRLRGDAVVLGTGEFGIAGWPDAETNPAVAACDQADQYLVVWQSSAANSDIYGRFIKGDGTPDTPNDVYHFPSTSLAEQRPAIACNAAGQHYLVVWEQQYSSLTGQFGIFGQDVSPDKIVGTDFGIMVPTSGVAAEFTNPAVAGGGATFLAVWQHDRAGTSYQDIHGRLFSLNALFMPTMKRVP